MAVKNWRDRVAPWVAKVKPVVGIAERVSSIAVHMQKPTVLGVLGLAATGVNALAQELNNGRAPTSSIQTLISKGQRKGAFYPPGVLTNVSPDSPSYKEELFGPVATVYKAFSEEQAVELANDTPFGLGSYVFTTDKEQAKRVADRIEAGMVFINAVGVEGVELPFGGVKRSGFGRELGRFGIDEFVNKKLIRVG